MRKIYLVAGAGLVAAAVALWQFDCYHGVSRLEREIASHRSEFRASPDRMGIVYRTPFLPISPGESARVSVFCDEENDEPHHFVLECRYASPAGARTAMFIDDRLDGLRERDERDFYQCAAAGEKKVNSILGMGRRGLAKLNQEYQKKLQNVKTAIRKQNTIVAYER